MDSLPFENKTKEYLFVNVYVYGVCVPHQNPNIWVLYLITNWALLLLTLESLKIENIPLLLLTNSTTLKGTQSALGIKAHKSHSSCYVY